MTTSSTRPSATSASRTRHPTSSSAPATSSTTGIVTPATQSDHIGRNVSAYGSTNHLCAWPTGVSVKTL